MQLTQALTLVPERKREEDLEPSDLELRSARIAGEDIVKFITSSVRDMDIIEFSLPKILDFFSSKAKDDDEVKFATKGAISALQKSRGALNDADGDLGDLLYGLVKHVVNWAVKKVVKYVIKNIIKLVWRVAKWLIKNTVKLVARAVFRGLIVPAFEALAGFVATPVGLAIALTGGAAAAGYLIYKGFFDKSAPGEKKTSGVEDEEVDNDGKDDAKDSETSAASQTSANPVATSAYTQPVRTSEASLTTARASAPEAAGAPVAAGPPPSGDVKQMIIKHEGMKLQPYKDSLGLWTVGVGHLIGDGKSLPKEFDRTFTKEEVYALFDEDFEKHRKAAMNIPNFTRLGEKAQAAFIDLTFNMGPVWYKRWPSLVQSMKDFNIAAVIENLRTSKWAKQVQASRVSDILSLLGTELSRTDVASQTPKMTPGVTTAATTQNQVQAASNAARPGTTVPPASNEQTIIKTPSGQMVAANMN
jgi:GH24 family phage-related lysozyme (muramidase)